MMAALAATCLASSYPKYESLSSSVMVALEETIKDSLATVVPPPYKSEDGNVFSTKFELITYKPQLETYQQTKDIYTKLAILGNRQFVQFKAAVIEDVLSKMKDKLNASTVEEAKQNIHEACDALNTEAKTALDEVKAKQFWEHEKFVNSDENLKKAASLAHFCYFLSL